MGKVNIALSESGKNAHYHHCAVKDQRCNYAVCLNTIKQSKNGTLRPQSDRNNCDQTIKLGECPAAKMRQEEIDADDALYYIPRESPEPSYVKGWETVKNGGMRRGETPIISASKGAGKSHTSSYRKPSAKPKTKTHAEHMDINMSKVISDAAKSEAKQAKTPAQAKQTPKPTKTETSDVTDALALMIGS